MGWDTGSLGPPVSRVQVELYTAAFRVTGHLSTRFRRAADILNLTGSTHLVLEGATIEEYGDPAASRGGPAVMVSVDAVLFGITEASEEAPTEELAVHKRPVRIQLALPPFWLTGVIHVPQGSQPTDVLNVAERFLPLTDVAVTSAAYARFDGNAPTVAVQRGLAELMLITDDAPADNALAFIPEEEARSWLPPEVES